MKLSKFYGSYCNINVNSTVTAQVYVKRSVKGRESSCLSDNGNSLHMVKTLKPPIVRKGKLVVVDLAGSERIDKSGV